MFGILRLDSIPFDQPIIMWTVGVIVVLILLVLVLITYFGKWGYLFREWVFSVDHKKIGVMYIIVAILMLVRGFADAIMMRTHQAIASTGAAGYLPAHHYDQIFTAHGTIMIFFMAMPFMTGLFNIVIPLQIGARDVAFPFLNSLSFWLTAMAMLLVNLSLFFGEFAQTGWLAYPPLAEEALNTLGQPNVGVDYWIWSIQLSGLGTLLTGINFFVTIVKCRAPGMSLMKMPIFIWASLGSIVMILTTFPVLTATLGLMALDRYLDMHFFTNDLGGNQMMYVNLIWAWGHPEVYILVLPAFGIYSEVVATFCKKRLFGYTSMVWATMAITILSLIVWLHHFFTMGAGANVNTFFGIMTMIIAVPTGVKVFNWIFTMYQGRIEFSAPMIWTIGFLITFVIGGMTGVMLSIPGNDYVFHNSLFLVAHFHNTIIGGVVLGYLAGYTYWFPKVFGFKLNETLGKWSALCWVVGFFVAFVPLYFLGFMGATRRISQFSTYPKSILASWHPYFAMAMVGAFIILIGILLFVIQLVVSIINHKKYRDITGDPWGGRTLEWSVASPVPFYNFAFIPEVTTRDAWWEMKEKGTAYQKPEHYDKIHMPKNTSVGFIIAVFGLILTFSLVWHIWWLATIGLLGMIIPYIVHCFNDNTDYYVSAEEVGAIENQHLQSLKAQV